MPEGNGLTAAIVYVDESGDLGWSLQGLYGRGGSSRHLTIAALLLPRGKKHLPKRLIKRLYLRHGWDPGQEKKWSEMSPQERLDFARLALTLSHNNPDFTYCSITVRKTKVEAHIRDDPNKLYNYMLKLLLIDRLGQFDVATLVPDERTIKVESGNSLPDYLQTELWFEHGSKVKLFNKPSDSSGTRNLQFVDMLAGTVQSHFERGSSGPFNVLQGKIAAKTLFF